MPLNFSLKVEIFDVWAIDFVKSFPSLEATNTYWWLWSMSSYS